MTNKYMTNKYMINMHDSNGNYICSLDFDRMEYTYSDYHKYWLFGCWAGGRLVTTLNEASWEWKIFCKKYNPETGHYLIMIDFIKR